MEACNKLYVLYEPLSIQWVGSMFLCFHFLATIFSIEADKTKSGPVLVCQCKAWALALKYKHILKLYVCRVFLEKCSHIQMRNRMGKLQKRRYMICTQYTIMVIKSGVADGKQI